MGSLGSSSARPRRSPALPAFSFNPGAGLSPESANDRPQRSPALPEFTFNPSPFDSANSLMSPPLSPGSPTSPRTIPNRGGHRRGASEFVGGKLKQGDALTIMSTSPTKSESGFPSPSLAPVDPYQRRGRHQHRRSAAISSHDLSMILKPPSSPNASRGSSAPSSPADFEGRMRHFPEPAAEVSKEAPKQEEMPEEVRIAPDASSSTDETAEPSPTIKPARAKVGFSDTLEYIPRPLSMVSTDTASTVTGYPGHSVSGSISSIISLGSATIVDRERPVLSSPIKKSSDSRPSTAGAVLERVPSLLASYPFEETPTSPRRRNSIPLLPGITTEDAASSPLPSPTKMPKRWSFFGLEPFTSSNSPYKQRPHSSSSSDTAAKGVETINAPFDADLESDDEAEEQNVSKKASKKKKQKKVKAWAGSILTRKAKSKSKSSGRPHTPPPAKEMLDDCMYEDDLDMSGPLTAPMVMVTDSSSPTVEAKPVRPRRKSEDDALYPMIDLDAALGPFNTPTGRDPAWDAAQKPGAPPKRQLHSAAGMRGFSGPGMHYHRRAESAPEMPPFEARFGGIHRFGSSSTMADVFEEDEEEDDDYTSGAESASQASIPDTSTVSGANLDARSTSDESATTPTQEIDFARKNSAGALSIPSSIKRKGSGSSLDLQPLGSRVRTEASISSLHEEVISEEAPVHHTTTAVDQERIYETYLDSDTVAPSPRRIITGKDLAPVEIHPISLPSPLTGISPYSMSHSSSFPSPRSPMSYDAHRVSTAPSSVTEENNFQSLLMGEPGPEVVRISVDVPSLTESTSNITRESNFSGVRPRGMPFHEQRPASFTTTAFGRRRSSLASLSRLISTSHGERSKLSMEVPLDNESDKKSKASTAKRLSRMIQFWKPKESAAS
ncbi:hypothetical protein BKA67DRAFT_522513 [Truncatella angustata]|uniref:Cell wall proline rich protein n=1 Tax=Truncatella angustata TaxID=152316 RepID=A0A9P8ZUH8_9PEZI|nr:uncharacterized protein BKA67DRAFT_522513 [Truncatella angustata]KAH6648293.1 hypothetical protein BKA67DRAFT_522513 [Truncatella angustata]